MQSLRTNTFLLEDIAKGTSVSGSDPMDRYPDRETLSLCDRPLREPSPVGMVSGGAEEQVGRLEGILSM